MPTYSALTTLAGRDAARALGEAMEKLTPEPSSSSNTPTPVGSGRWEVGGYFTEPPDEAALALLAAAFGARPFAVSELPEVDWVAHVKRELSPVVAGRFFVHGSHDADKVPMGSVGLLIEASMAFGTGHHGTTLGCLQALEALLQEGFVARSVADIGCGTAVLAMAAARVFPNPVIAGDIDPVAVEVAEANVAANALTGQVSCVEAAGFGHPLIAGAAPFDLVFANILKGPLMEMAPQMRRHMQPGGIAILSGILNEQAGEVAAAYANHGYDLRRSEKIGDWTTLTLELKRL